MALKRGTIMSLRISNELLDRIEQSVNEGKFPNASEALRTYVEMGMLADEFKASITNPDFLKSIEELKQGNAMFDWAKSLTPEQMDALASALQFEKEQRYEQEHPR